MIIYRIDIYIIMSHVRLEEDVEVFDIPWVDIISMIVIVGLVMLKLKS